MEITRWHPLAECFPIMQGQEWEEFLDDVRASGGNVTPISYRLLDGVAEGLDGRQRYKANCELGLPSRMAEVEVPDDQVATFIIRANLRRRHLTAEGRRSIIAKLRSDGMSERQIAATLQVSKTTVHNDIQAAENPGGHKRPPQTPAAATPADSGDNDAPQLTDSLDVEVPPGLVTVFQRADDFREIVNQLNAIGRKLKELKGTPAGTLVRLQDAEIDLKHLKETVRFDAPFCVCPACKGIAKARKANCPCKQRGWLAEASYKALPQEFRQ